MRTRVLLLLGAAMVFGVVNWQVAGKERLRASGQSVFLELAPVDPRSLRAGGLHGAELQTGARHQRPD